MPVVTEPGRVIAGRYRLLSMLGSGGMGTVWRAEDELLGRMVAVKEVAPPTDATSDEGRTLRERTLHEARIAARLAHQNVVTVYDVAEDGGRPWIVMELVDARSLRDIVEHTGPLTPRQTAEIGCQLLSALRAAHALGIVHRDVKPGNVLIDDDGRAVLADFGIARTLDSPTVTRSGVIVGSPAYTAPERARGERGGPASDLWALGATLYAAVEGRPPYQRDGAWATLNAVVTEDPDPPGRAGPLWPVLRGLLAADPASRLGPETSERMLREVAGGADEGATAPLTPGPLPSADLA
ncbi:MAG TPA: serine/threonine-protein kinase, partial [Streptosporangiaceae bacterium]|nr:serine/threonine-protein kinase [Streptosporangiaceae bacterium]